MNFFHYLFPTLLKRKEPFLISMQTPIVRVFNRGGDILFYDENRFKEYVKDLPQKPKFKYYKGLGTTKTEDVPDTFGEKIIEFIEDKETEKNINKVFNKNYADDRKKWLEHYTPISEFSLDDGGKVINMNMSNFLNQEVIKFSYDDCKRSIPSLFDGLKESQRKVLYAVKKKNLTYNKPSMKVAQLGGYVAEQTNYHHGEQNLYQTITKMAQEFPGANNIPLLYRDGQFGCLDPDTLILMWNGDKKKARYVVVGDKLVGDDGYPRTVKQITNGVDDMYVITHLDGSKYKVNSQHILTLKCIRHKSIWWCDCASSWCVTYYDPKLKQVINKSVEVSSRDDKTRDEVYSELYNSIIDIPDESIFDIKLTDYLNMTERMKHSLKSVKMSTYIRWNNFIENAYEEGKIIGEKKKRIPKEYFSTDILSRIELLRGITEINPIIQEKEYYVSDESASSVWQKNNHLQDVEFLCNSLGFNTERRNNSLLIKFRDKINQSISVSYVGKGHFVGWSVDGNERFLLGDFTVTHNSRLHGGEDAASPRYIYTKMETLTPLLFRSEDDELLDYVEDDGDKLEPQFYVPILPMILINGVTAIATGWSSSIPCFNPKDVIECIKLWLDNDGEVIFEDPDDNTCCSLLPELIPWYRGYTGKIEKEDNKKFITHGTLNKEKNKVKITELPIGIWTEKFKEYCEDLLVEKQIKSLHNESTPTKVNFTITESDDGLSCNLKNMKMSTYLNLTNMVLFNEKNQLKKYSIDEIINDFCVMRYSLYRKRKKHIIGLLENELKHLGNKARFIEEVVSKKLNIMNVDENILIKDLEKRGYDKEIKKDGGEEDDKGYNYLLRMPVRVLTADQIKKLRNDIDSNMKKLQQVRNTTEKMMWLRDISEFETEYEKWLKNMEIIANKTIKKKNKK